MRLECGHDVSRPYRVSNPINNKRYLVRVTTKMKFQPSLLAKLTLVKQQVLNHRNICCCHGNETVAMQSVTKNKATLVKYIYDNYNELTTN